MSALDNFKQAAITLVIVALVLAAFALALDAFREDIGADQCAKRTDSYTVYNTTSNVCQNSTGNTVVVGTHDYNVTSEGLEGTANATSYLSTIGTLLGVAALIAIVMGAFYMVRR